MQTACASCQRFITPFGPLPARNNIDRERTVFMQETKQKHGACHKHTDEMRPLIRTFCIMHESQSSQLNRSGVSEHLERLAKHIDPNIYQSLGHQS